MDKQPPTKRRRRQQEMEKQSTEFSLDKSNKQQNVAGFATSGAVGYLQSGPIKQTNQVSYGISVMTSGAKIEAGTNCKVYFELIGQNSNESTGYLELNHLYHFLHDSFESGQLDHFKITAADVGLPRLIRIKLENSRKDSKWFCEQIVVSLWNKSTKVHFRVFDWVTDGMQVMSETSGSEKAKGSMQGNIASTSVGFSSPMLMMNLQSMRSEQTDNVSYSISVKTSDAYSDAGINCKVYFELVGQNGTTSTGYLEIDDWHWFSNTFEKGQVNHYKISAKDVGLPILIRIKLENSHKDNKWLCERIVVSINDDPTKVHFPVYDWIVDEMQVMKGTAVLPQDETIPAIKSARTAEVHKSKVTYEWVRHPMKGDVGWGLPRYVNANKYEELPSLFKRNEIRERNFKQVGLQAGIDAVLGFLKEKLFHPLNNLQAFKELYSHKNVDDDIPISDDWSLDKVMGRQILTGISPLMVSRCSELPSYFNVTHNDVKMLLDDGKTLEEEMKSGKIYISDYVTMVKGIERSNGFFCPECVGLFYSNKRGDFLPIAIQLVPDDRKYLFTSDDKKYDWLLAKMYFRCAFSNIHEWVFHFLHTHNIVEPFAVALFRCFPRCHPIYKLMRPHLRTIAAINTDARTSLIPEGSLASKALALSAIDTSRTFFKKFTFEDLIIPKQFKKQGTDSETLLPDYFYRDDAMALWKVMDNFVGNVIRHYYTSDDDVAKDLELQDFAQDVAKNGLGWQDNNTRGMPEQITSIDQLIEICVTLMFTSSAQHAAVNFGQFNNYKFIPNSPTCMRLPPHRKGEANLERILNSLPDARQSITAIAITHALSSLSPNEVYLGNYPEHFFTEEAILKMQQNYKKELGVVEEKINRRNKNLEQKYELLLPSRVPNSIAI